MDEPGADALRQASLRLVEVGHGMPSFPWKTCSKVKGIHCQFPPCDVRDAELGAWGTGCGKGLRV